MAEHLPSIYTGYWVPAPAPLQKSETIVCTHDYRWGEHVAV